VQRNRPRLVVVGEPPDPTNAPTGCPFTTRCPWVMDICRVEMPPHTPITTGGTVACHLQTTGPTLAGKTLADLPVPTEEGEAEGIKVAEVTTPSI
jgi:hypothetical protein